MKLPVYLQTKDGLNLYKKVHAEYNDCKQSGALTAFYDKYETMREDVSKLLSDFLYDDEFAQKYKMDETDTLGWTYYKEMADRFSIFNFFTKGKYGQ